GSRNHAPSASGRARRLARRACAGRPTPGTPCGAAPWARRIAPNGAVARLLLEPLPLQRFPRRAPLVVERRMAHAAAAQQRQLLGAQVRAAHREAVAGVARALDRRFLLVVPDPLFDEAERHVLELGIGILRVDQAQRAAREAEKGMAVAGRGVADAAVVALLHHQREGEAALVADRDLDSLPAGGDAMLLDKLP